MSLTKNSRYRAEIDGLRALAVLPVVFFHLGLGFPGGFTGVDVFFVISGFLICGIILRESAEGRFSMIRFYERRVRRILPAFFAVIFASLVLAALVLYPVDFDLMGHHLSYISLFASNIELAMFEGGYWSADAKTFPLLHTWSLAVEEQFYFVMPLVLLALHRWCRKHLFGAMLFFFVLSFAYCIYATQTMPQQAFYLLPSRAWEMLMGGIVYLLIQRESPFAKAPAMGGVVGVVGLVLVVGSYFMITGEMAFPGYIALFPTLGTTLFIYSNSWGNNWTGRLLAWSPFQFIGKISYSLYLWHWPLIIFLKAHRWPEELVLSDKIMLLVVSLIAAVLSWKFVEQPFRHPAKPHSTLKAFVPACALVVLMFATSLAIRVYDGFPVRVAWIEGEAVARIQQEQKALGLAGNQPIFNAEDQFDKGGYQVNVLAGEVPQLVVIGDSHAGIHGPSLSQLSTEYSLPVSFFTLNGICPLIETDVEVDEVVYRYIQEWQPHSIVLIVRLDSLIGKIRSDPSYAKKWEMALRRVSENCETLYFVLQAPKSVGPSFNGSYDILQLRLISLLMEDDANELPRLVDEPQVSRIARLQTRTWLDGLGLPNLRILDSGVPLLEGGQVRITDQGRLLYLDDDHLSNFGAEYTKDLFRPVFERIESQFSAK